jgi:hypothetical protein
MIVNINRWHTPEFGRLIHYVQTDKMRADPSKDFTIYHNLPFWNERDAVKEFESNHRYLKKRKNGVCIYHEVMAFHAADTPSLTLQKLEDMATRYIQMRCPRALVYAKAHVQNASIHVHFVISGSELQSPKTLRLENEDFNRVRYGIERYQIEKYPELVHSIVHHGRQKNRYRDAQGAGSANPSKKKGAEGKQHHKDRLKGFLGFAYGQAADWQAFEKLLQGAGLEVYIRKGKAQGVKEGKVKYRFSTLGLDREKVEELLHRSPKYHERYMELQKLKEQKREREKGRDEGIGRER